jgi:hypothetical protein
MKKDQELIGITKAYDRILWSCKHTRPFPGNHRFVPSRASGSMELRCAPVELGRAIGSSTSEAQRLFDVVGRKPLRS